MNTQGYAVVLTVVVVAAVVVFTYIQIHRFGLYSVPPKFLTGPTDADTSLGHTDQRP